MVWTVWVWFDGSTGPEATAKTLLRPYLENSLRPLYEPIQYTQVTQRRVLIGVVHATWRQRLDGSTRRVTGR